MDLALCVMAQLSLGPLAEVSILTKTYRAAHSQLLCRNVRYSTMHTVTITPMTMKYP